MGPPCQRAKKNRIARSAAGSRTRVSRTWLGGASHQAIWCFVTHNASKRISTERRRTRFAGQWPERGGDFAGKRERETREGREVPGESASRREHDGSYGVVFLLVVSPAGAAPAAELQTVRPRVDLRFEKKRESHEAVRHFIGMLGEGAKVAGGVEVHRKTRRTAAEVATPASKFASLGALFARE